MNRLNWSGMNIDPIAVELAVAGRRAGELNQDERLAAVDEMFAKGLPPTVIAHRIGCHKRTVMELLAELARRTGGEAA